MKFLGLTLAGAMTASATAAPHLAGYFANWAQYHPDPYGYKAEALEAVMDKLDILYYSFAYFCPPEDAVQPYWVTELNYCDDKEPFQLTSVEPDDEDFYKTIQDMRTEHNPDQKLVLSIGGWNFPSNFWSRMVSTKESRATFIKSCGDFMEKYGFDGIDVDWEYPCSDARTDPVKITCDFFYTVEDEGGNCETDKDGLLDLVKEMREAFGDDKLVTVASQAGMENADKGFHLAEMTKYIDHFNLMSYDYSVSDIESANVTAPNMPLYSPKKEGVPEWGVDYTVQGYLDAGVPADKMVLGVAMYGHSWYIPGLKGDEWKQWGLEAQVQGECCGVFSTTYGAKYGKGCGLCGTMMFSEIRAAGCETWFDEETQSNIQYCAEDSEDGWTAGGTWTSYNDLDSHAVIAQYALDKGLKGAFVFDMSEDSMDDGATEFTYEITTLYHNAIHGAAGDDTPAGDDSTPSGDSCDGKTDGHYCKADGSGFYTCPGLESQDCPAGLVCKTTDTDVMCDWA